MLDDAVEEHREEPAVHQSGRAFVDKRESNSPRTGFVVEPIEAVLGKARVERADVRRMVQIHPVVAGLVDPDPGALFGGATARNSCIPTHPPA